MLKYIIGIIGEYSQILKTAVNAVAWGFVIIMLVMMFLYIIETL